MLQLDGRVALVDQPDRLVPQVLGDVPVLRDRLGDAVLALDGDDVRAEQPLRADVEHALERGQAVVGQSRLGAADGVQLGDAGEELVGDDDHVELGKMDSEIFAISAAVTWV